MIIQILIIPVLFYIFILALFIIIQRPAFIFFNRKFSDVPIRPKDLILIYKYGLKTDIIAAAYVTIIPIVMTYMQSLCQLVFLPIAFDAYCAVVGLAIILIVEADVLLYKYWQYKIDSSVLPYLRSIKGACASVSNGYIFVAVMIVIISWILVSLFFIFSGMIGGIEHPFIAATRLQRVLSTVIFVCLLMGCFCVIRGLSRRPKNPAISFFSKNLFFNHSALNPISNFIYSLSINDKLKGSFQSVSDEECKKEFNLLMKQGHGNSIKLLTSDRPNILVFVWESLCARFIEIMGGEGDVTPNFNMLAQEGILFSRVDASGTRTHQGLVSIFSGYPSPPTASIIRMTRKLPKLPSLPRVFKNLGYITTILHGGDLSIFHKKEYYLSIGHDNVIDENKFPSSLPHGKWGIHDGVTMDWLFNDIMEKTRNYDSWFTTYQTLSSHETWEVPYSRLLPDNPVENSFAYVDDAFGNLIAKLKKTSAWDNLLVVVVGDHGCNMCEPIARSKYPHIPILFLGGVIRNSMVIDKIMSQSDLAATLLGQLKLNHEEFIFSRDVMSPDYVYPFSFHTFSNGFMIRDDKGYTIVDNTIDKAIENPDDQRERNGKILLQYLYKNLNDL